MKSVIDDYFSTGASLYSTLFDSITGTYSYSLKECAGGVEIHSADGFKTELGAIEAAETYIESEKHA